MRDTAATGAVGPITKHRVDLVQKRNPHGVAFFFDVRNEFLRLSVGTSDYQQVYKVCSTSQNIFQ